MTQFAEAIAQVVMPVLALMAAIGVPWWQQREGRKEDRTRRAVDLAGLRLALHTEVGAIGLQCLIELNSWAKAAASPAPKNLRTAKLPRLVIYEANASKIGLLTRGEIMGLISFSGMLYDISVVIADMGLRSVQGPDDLRVLQALLSNACGATGDFLEAVTGIEEADKDRPFIQRLRAAQCAGEADRSAATRSFLAAD